MPYPFFKNDVGAELKVDGRSIFSFNGFRYARLANFGFKQRLVQSENGFASKRTVYVHS